MVSYALIYIFVGNSQTFQKSNTINKHTCGFGTEFEHRATPHKLEWKHERGSKRDASALAPLIYSATDVQCAIFSESKIYEFSHSHKTSHVVT